MPQKKLYSSLHIHQLELHLNLGWRNKERSQEQAVFLDMDIRFPSPPKACKTDNLDDTICYAKLIEVIREKISAKKYRLIEHVCAEIYTITKNHWKKNTRITIRLTKYPRIDGLKKGVTFDYGDEK